MRNCKGEGAVHSNSQQDTLRPGKISFLFSNEKERKSCKKRRGGGRERQRETG